MSEFGAGASLSFLDSTEEQCVEASGYPAPGHEIKIVDPETGREQPADTPGEILMRGYMLMQGYYDRPEETAEAIDGDGWMHTGDTGLFRGDGHLRFMGRYKDMLKIGGENVDPMEVEAFLMAHPAIHLAAVVFFVDEFPMTSSGKIQKAKLREQALPWQQGLDHDFHHDVYTPSW
jgi:fatty-acyl-CoA synthase